MRAGRLLLGLLVAVLIALGASWATYKRDYVVHERAAAEWVALTLTDQALAKGAQPQNADAAVFLSNAVIDKALKQLAGTTIKPPVSKVGDLTITVEGGRVLRSLGLMGAVIDVNVSSAQRGIMVKMQLDGNLAFRGITPHPQSDEGSIATAEFAISIMKAEPMLKWGFVDFPARQFLSEAISSGLMIALDNHLSIAVPFKDRLIFNTGFSSDATVPAPEGTVKLNTSLTGKILEQRFSFSAPLFLRSGVWLLATTSSSGQAPVVPPSVPKLQPAELESHIAALREHVATVSRDLEQNYDLVLLLKGSALIGLVDQLRALPEANRTVAVHSTGTTGHLVDNETLLLELPDAHDVNASLVIGPPSATWMPGKGVSLATDLRMDLRARIHAHVKPVVNMGTAFGLEGGAGKRVTGTLDLTDKIVDGHSVLLLTTTMPCDTLTADVTTDGRLVLGPIKVDLVKVGVRWTMPVPPTLGQPNLVLDDLPRRVALDSPRTDDQTVTITPAHKAIEYTMHVTDAKATQTGYLVAANLDMQPVDDTELPAEIVSRRQALADRVRAEARAATNCSSVDPDMKVLFGGVEFGKNNEIVKAFTNMLHDLQHGPGPNNDITRNLGNVVHDLQHGPGPNNDLVGRHGWVRRTLGF
jgi:hypothetical protein